MKTKRFLAAALAGLTFACMGGTALAQRGGTTVVLVDREKVVTEADAFKSITSQLQAVTNQLQADLQQKEAALTQSAQALQQTRESLSKDDFQKRAAALTKQELDLLADQEIANRELTVARNEALAKLDQPLKDALETIAKKRKGAIVLDKNMVVYAGNAPDVSDDVLKELNRKLSSVQVVKPTTSVEDRAAIRQQIEQQIAMQQMEAVGRRQVLALGQQSLQAAANQ